MTSLIDYILDLFRSPDVAASFIQDPDGAMRDAGLPNVSAAQLASVAATAAPAGVALGGGDPVHGLQRAVADYHSIASPFSPQTTFAPQTQTDFASHNATQVASNNDFMSPDQAAGANAQNGAFNLGFGDITFGDKTTNTATDGGVVNTGTAGDIDTTNVEGDGNVVGDDNNANTGVIEAGDHSPVIIGEDNDTEVSDSSQHSGGDIITGNEGNIIKDNDMSGGHGGNASSGAGGGLLGGIGNDSEANAGGGGGGGSIILTDASSHDSSTTVGGDQTTVNAGHDVTGGVDASHDDNSVDNSDNSVHDSHDDNSTHDSHDATVETHVDVSNDVGLF
ncbi:IniB N-terminal domain-containing protein [Mycobacterium sp. URHB0044]|jgi:hypothetical protein|uniref:IniB N-terminal domain-containing protein n=1 Tax=Mycobacterium sp. URHB0044 TaxID=1380386 RepID=UPI00048EA75A|nr:IniB N-terminal domain-containing protein [Mycobacterium sp. URHB0044]